MFKLKSFHFRLSHASYRLILAAALFSSGCAEKSDLQQITSTPPPVTTTSDVATPLSVLANDTNQAAQILEDRIKLRLKQMHANQEAPLPFNSDTIFRAAKTVIPPSAMRHAIGDLYNNSLQRGLLEEFIAAAQNDADVRSPEFAPMLTTLEGGIGNFMFNVNPYDPDPDRFPQQLAASYIVEARGDLQGPQNLSADTNPSVVVDAVLARMSEKQLRQYPWPRAGTQKPESSIKFIKENTPLEDRTVLSFSIASPSQFAISVPIAPGCQTSFKAGDQLAGIMTVSTGQRMDFYLPFVIQLKQYPADSNNKGAFHGHVAYVNLCDEAVAIRDSLNLIDFYNNQAQMEDAITSDPGSYSRDDELIKKGTVEFSFLKWDPADLQDHKGPLVIDPSQPLSPKAKIIVFDKSPQYCVPCRAMQHALSALQKSCDQQLGFGTVYIITVAPDDSFKGMLEEATYKKCVHSHVLATADTFNHTGQGPTPEFIIYRCDESTHARTLPQLIKSGRVIDARINSGGVPSLDELQKMLH